MIKNIKPLTAHKIKSGQVITSLALAVKELVENSIDAGANVIEVKVKNYGIEIISVRDNGKGISKEDFVNVAREHSTSKLKEFNDLSRVNTFGFRGEALSCLCAACGIVEIETNDTMDSVGWKLLFGVDGELKSQLNINREKGTTVVLKEIFKGYPVRCQEFKKNCKREFGKLVVMIQGYAIGMNGIRFKLVHQPTNGAKWNCVINTNGQPTLKQNILDVFGVKMVQSLKEIEIEVVEGNRQLARVSGFVSKADNGCGRASADRHYLFMNKRYCDISKLSRLINEIYREQNSKQYPCVFLHIFIPKGSFDLNVTPDKRTLFLYEEELIMQSIRLYEYFTPKEITLNVQSRPSQAGNLLNFVSPERMAEQGKRAVDEMKRRNSILLNNQSVAIERDVSIVKSKRNRSESDSSPLILNRQKVHCEDINLSDNENDDSTTVEILHETLRENNENKRANFDFVDLSQIIKETRVLEPEVFDSAALINSPSECDRTVPIIDLSQIIRDTGILEQNSAEIESIAEESTDSVESTREENETFNPSLHSIQIDLQCSDSIYDTPDESMPEPMQLNTSITASIDNPEAEKLLSRTIHKSDFESMQVIGQFNLGFIIAKLKNDLYILDQHASDEKHTYETLIETTKINKQRLIQPRFLRLTHLQEVIATENIKSLAENGYDISVDSEGQFWLKTLPYIKGIQCGIQGKTNLSIDLHELLSLIEKRPKSGKILISKLQSVYASRACRTSVMIGTCLSRAKMESITKNMATMEHPWNCPHGRPTMRHLLTLKRN